MTSGPPAAGSIPAATRSMGPAATPKHAATGTHPGPKRLEAGTGLTLILLVRMIVDPPQNRKVTIDPLESIPVNLDSKLAKELAKELAAK